MGMLDSRLRTLYQALSQSPTLVAALGGVERIMGSGVAPVSPPILVMVYAGEAGTSLGGGSVMSELDLEVVAPDIWKLLAIVEAVQGALAGVAEIRGVTGRMDELGMQRATIRVRL